MTALGQSRAAKVEQLTQWLQSIQSSPKSSTIDGAQFLTDVDLLEHLAATFNNLASTEGVRNLCKLFFDSYVSGDKNVQLLVILLLPSMLLSYLIEAHQAPSQHKRTSNPSSSSFTIGDETVPLTGFDALSFLLIDLCSLAPNYLRAPDIVCVDQLPLPDPWVSSVFHNAPETAFTPNGTVGGVGNSSSTTNAPAVFFHSQNMSFNSKTPVSSIATGENVTQQSLNVAACLLQVCTDTLIQQRLLPPHKPQKPTAEGSPSAAVLFSARSFCSFVQRVTSLTERPRIRCTPSFLITLINSIDSFLFLLNFEREFRLGSGSADGGHSTWLPSTQTAQLRSTLFKLLSGIERFANYHCFSSVLLLGSAVRHAWLTRYRQMPPHLTATERRDPRFLPMSSIDLVEGTDTFLLPYVSSRSVSAQPQDLDVLSELPVIGEFPASPFAASKVTRKTSAITNASFKPESVPEDIPISNSGDGDGSSHHLLPRRMEPMMFSEQLTRSTENISSLGGGGDCEGDHESKNVRRAPIAANLLNLNI
uniref:Hyccin n=1 Tax=Schistocephalus solidus TaxID=70667 RepID=A0A0X3NYF7_SCHSO